MPDDVEDTSGYEEQVNEPVPLDDIDRAPEPPLDDPQEQLLTDNEFVTDPTTGLLVLPEDLPSDATDVEIQQQIQDQLAGEGYFGNPYDDEGNILPGWSLDENNNPVYVGTNTPTGDLFIEPALAASAAATRALVQQAQSQQTISSQRRQINNADWRVRLRLAPAGKYLYNAPNPGILKPLQVTDGVVFPYTPTIDTVYRADYDAYALTHSNYKGYFYKGSFVDPINVKCTFTAQSTSEANYLLAVITFFKSATKMFYGQDAERGAPPPLVYLSGLGEYQFNEHPCMLSQFSFNLPGEVDYIRAGSATNLGVDQVNLRDRQNVATYTNFGGLNRLAAAFLTKGAIPNPLAPMSLTTNNPTYVPTKMDISITLLPVQSRKQVSKQFSLKEFANGNLIKGGFW